MSRRAVMEMLGFGAAAAALGAGRMGQCRWRVRASRRSTRFPVRYPMHGRFKFFEGPDGSPMGVRPCSSASRMTTAALDGGRAFRFPKWSDETLETVTTTIRQYLAPELIGRDPADIPGAHAVMNRSIAPAFSTGQPIAKAGIDIALHDLVAREARRQRDGAVEPQARTRR